MLSIIICTYNRDKYLYDALRHVAENDFPLEKYEIVLVNNNSTDNTEAECRRFQNDFPKVVFHYFMEINQGLSYARNRGITEAQGEMLVFLDDDAFAGKNYLRNLQKNVENHPDLAAFGGKIMPLFETGIAPKWLSKWSCSWVSAIDLGSKTRQFEGAKYPVGANMGIMQKMIEKVGNFNTALGRNKKNLMGGEEKDIFNRIKSEKGKIYYFPDIEVQHVIPESRTTDEFIKRLGLGVGTSEKIRTLNISKSKYLKRIIFETIKWAASILLFFRYLIVFQPEKGTKLLQFRWHVTKGLLF